MKIFVAGKRNPDSFTDNIAFTLELMGHEVATQPIPMEISLLKPLTDFTTRLVKPWLTDGPAPHEHKLLHLIEQSKPEVFISPTEYYTPAALHEISKLCPLRILWWGDPAGNSYRMGLLDPNWSHIFIKDKDIAQKIQLSGVSCSYLPEAMNPAWHRPLRQNENNCIVIAGNFYNFRIALVKRLLDDGHSCELYGPKPPRWAHQTIHDHWLRKYITKENKSEIFGAGLACLNSFSFAEANSLNCRAFEIAGAAGLQLIEYRPVVEELFEPGKEILPFSNYEQLTQLLQRAATHPREMVPIREAAARRVLAEHTYFHRLSVILATVGLSSPSKKPPIYAAR